MENLLTCFFTLASLQLCAGLHMRAYFDQKDFIGYVQFGQHNASMNLEINFKLRENMRVFQNISFKVTRGPSIYEDFCKNVGSVMHDFSADHGYINYNSNFTDHKIKIMGKGSVFGNSISLFNESGSVVACSTILPHGKVIYAKANILSATVGGSFDFIQSEKGGDTFIYGAVRDNQNSAFKRNYNVIISADTADHASCEPLHQVYNPNEESGQGCSTHNQTNCAIGALTAKHGSLSIGKDAPGMFFGIDTTVNLQGSFSAVSHYVVLKKMNGENVGCGKITIAGPLEVISLFNEKSHKGISGYLKFTQPSPYHFTEFETELSGLGERVGGYHVHRFPISDRKNPCSGPSVGGHVNTWKVDIKKSPAPFKGSLDQYEVGDLSGRYGGLNGLDVYSYTTQDANLPLYGLHTILGRSIVIHETNGARFVCSNIEPSSYRLKVSSLTNFTDVKDSPVTGTILSMQYIQRNGMVTRTISIVDIKHKDGSKTNSHKWSMNTGPVSGNTCPGRSTSSNPKYNPVKVNDLFCNEKNPFLCPIGDLSGKVGTYDMQQGKSFFSDENLPMMGEMTSLGRSIVLYKKDNSPTPLACANIIPRGGRSIAKMSFDLQNRVLKDDVAQLRNTLVKAFDFPDGQGYRINSLTTSDTKDDDGCFRVEFYMIDTNKPPNAANYKCGLEEILKSEDKMSHFKMCKRSSALVIVPSVVVTVVAIIATLLN